MVIRVEKAKWNNLETMKILRKLANEKVVIRQCIGGWVVVGLLWAVVGL